MRIQYDFEYDTCCSEIADEFCDHDSEYQAETINFIGEQFKIWAQDKKRPMTFIQIMEIAEQLSDEGKWFIRTLYDYIEGKAKSEDKG